MGKGIMRDNDTLILETLYRDILLLEFSEKAISMMVAHFQKTTDLSEKTIRDYISTFEKARATLPKKDPFQYKTFDEFEHATDSTRVGASKQVESVSKDDLKVYEDAEVIVYKSTNTGQSIILSDNGYYSFCVSRPSGGNLWTGYRLRAASTFYFVRFKENTSEKDDRGMFKDPSHYIVIDAQTDDRYQWTWADNGSQGHGTDDITEEEIVEAFPDLSKPFSNGIFKNDPLLESEIQKIKKYESLNYDFSVYVFNSLKYVEKEEYIKSGFGVSDLSCLDKNLKNEYLNMGHQLNSENFKSLTPSEQNLWIKKRGDVLAGSGDSNESSNFAIFLIKNGKDLPDIFLNSIAKDSYESYKFAKALIEKGKDLPDIFLNSIAKYSDSSYRFAVALIENGKDVPDIILNSIAKDSYESYKFAKALIEKGKDVPDMFLNSIAKDWARSFEVANILIRNKKPIPDIIINGIKPQDKDKLNLTESISFKKFFHRNV